MNKPKIGNELSYIEDTRREITDYIINCKYEISFDGIFDYINNRMQYTDRYKFLYIKKFKQYLLDYDKLSICNFKIICKRLIQILLKIENILNLNYDILENNITDNNKEYTYYY